MLGITFVWKGERGIKGEGLAAARAFPSGDEGQHRADELAAQHQEAPMSCFMPSEIDRLSGAATTGGKITRNLSLLHL